jgi:hypothetical protein
MRMSVLSTIQSTAKVAGSLVETYLLSDPNASEAQVVAFVTKNADVLVNKVVTNPLIQGIADSIVNEIIAEDVPKLYTSALTKLGGVAASSADPS